MWLLSCRSAPEELIGSATLSAMKLKDAMEGDEIDCHVKAKMASDLLDGELRELKLILIGAKR